MPNNTGFIRQKYSKRHHFLPVFYLKGFANADGLLFVYDKQKDTILSKQRPEAIFYENHLNNYKLHGEVKLTMEEPIFTPLDTKAAKLFAKIRSSEFESKNTLTVLEHLEVITFIARLFWRSPNSNEAYVELIKKEGLSNKYIGFYRQATDELIPDEEISHIKEQFLTDSEIQKIFKHSVPISDGSLEETGRLYDKWRMYSLRVQIPNLITGDNPFLINNHDIRFDNVFNELIFPISKHRLLALADKSPSFLDAILMMYVNVSILHQSKRFVAADSEEGLRLVLEHYNSIIQLDRAKSLARDAFSLIHYQSQFKGYGDYLMDYDKAKHIWQAQ